MAKQYSSNILGEVYDHPRIQVLRASELKVGDHVAFHRNILGSPGRYWHHAIVEKVDHHMETIHIIHFEYVMRGKPFVAGKILASEVMLGEEEDDLFLLKHNPEDCLPADVVVERARSKLGRTDYNLLTNNCEHFALWCKTGEKSSSQVNTAAKFGGKCAMKMVGKAALYKSLSKGDDEEDGKKGRMVRSRSYGNQVDVGTMNASAMFEALAEGITAGIDIREAVEKRDKGEISQRDMEDAVVTRTAVACGDVAGSIIGSRLGASLGVEGSFIGDMFGGILGGLLGSAVGQAACDTRDTVEDSIDFQKLAIKY